ESFVQTGPVACFASLRAKPPGRSRQPGRTQKPAPNGAAADSGAACRALPPAPPGGRRGPSLARGRGTAREPETVPNTSPTGTGRGTAKVVALFGRVRKRAANGPIPPVWERTGPTRG